MDNLYVYSSHNYNPNNKTPPCPATHSFMVTPLKDTRHLEFWFQRSFLDLNPNKYIKMDW